MKKHPSSTRGLEHTTLADRVRSARRRASISQTELARRIGVSASAVAQWEHPSGTQPSLQSLIRIVEITGVSTDWLVMGKAARSVTADASDQEVSALLLETYAHSAQEETLLKVFREIPDQRRSLLVSLAEEFAARREASPRKRR